MKRWLWTLGSAGLIALIVFVVSNSQVNVSLEKNTESSFEIETSFPNATCSKTLSQDFPFAVIRCEDLPQLAEDASDEGISDSELLEAKP